MGSGRGTGPDLFEVAGEDEVAGRVGADDGELSAWDADIWKGSTNYSDLLTWNVNQMIGPPLPWPLNELRDMVRRANAGAALPEPGEAETTAQMGVVKLTASLSNSS